MCDEKHKGLVPYTEFSRRQFAALAAGTAALGAAGVARAQANVAERTVLVKTPDGNADASLYVPSGGPAPGVLVWPDAGGLRQSIRDMAKRLAGQGFVVLAVNPYYRSGDAAAVAPTGTGQTPEEQAARTARRALMTPEAVTRDAAAFVAYIDALQETSAAKIGVQGYCMGGPLSFRTAAIAPNRVGAVGSFHGGGLVTKDPTSPHLLIEKSSAQYLVAVAKNDDTNDPEAKNVLRDTFAKTGRKAVVEVYGGDHGWCVPDNGRYDKAEAERAWTALGALYKAALV